MTDRKEPPAHPAWRDRRPATIVGQMPASVVMILGYAIIAVPTGIVTVERSKASTAQVNTQSCPQCAFEGHDTDALLRKICGANLN